MLILLAGVLISLGGTGTGTHAGASRAHDDGPSASALHESAVHQVQRRPNVIMFVTDDMSADELPYLPAVQKLLVDRGVTFTHALAPDPLCCPARSTLLTGQYAHNHHVFGNKPSEHGGWAYFARLNQRNLLPVWLQKAGYRTWHVGKHLNGFQSRLKQPGWNFWSATVGNYYDYSDFTTATQGRVERHRGVYQEHFIRRRLRATLDRWTPSRRPFFMWVSHLAPHANQANQLPDPEPRYATAFDGFDFPLSPAIGEQDVSDKPPWALLEPNTMTPAKAQLAKAAETESLLSVDDTVSLVVSELREHHELRRTVLIFLSDNGYLVGEHRHHGKNVPYEEAIRVPLVIAGPGFAHGETFGRLVSLADVTATILGVAHASSGLEPDGLSLSESGRAARISAGRVIPIEGGITQVPLPYSLDTDRMGRFFWGARWRHYVYVQYKPGFREFYDLRADPYELDNAYRSHGASPAQLALAQWVHDHRNCSGRECNRPLNAPH